MVVKMIIGGFRNQIAGFAFTVRVQDLRARVAETLEESFLANPMIVYIALVILF